MRRTQGTALAGLIALATGVSLAGTTWACVPGGGGSGRKLSVDPTQARPGERVTVTAPPGSGGKPIEVRLDSATGPLLGVLGGGPAGSLGIGLTATFVVPTDAPPGRHALVAVQPGVRWEPALFGVAGASGAVPELSQSEAASLAAGGRTSAGTPLAAFGIAVVAAVAFTAVIVRRNGSSRPGTGRRGQRPGLPAEVAGSASRLWPGS